MLNIVCVKWGTKYGAEYVNILRDMTLRNLPEGFAGKFICFTDDAQGLAPSITVEHLPGHLHGWWNKLWLFRLGVFKPGDRVLYLDLDTAITGPLDAIAAYDGPFAILRDFYRPTGLQSAVMAWEAGKFDFIYDEYRKAGFPELPGGDQEWIETQVKSPDLWQRLFPGDFVSYREHARHGIPKGAKIVNFHGEPKPHECGDWVSHVWKIGGGTTAELVTEANVPLGTIEANIRAAMARNAKFLTIAEPHDGTALICAGGPSLKDELNSVRAHLNAKCELTAVNASFRFLVENGIMPAAHVILDARPENIAFVPEGEPHVERLYASQCDPSVLDAAGANLTLWHPLFDGILQITGEGNGLAYIGGGTTAGLKAVVIAFARGYRKIHLYGFDSSYRGDANHAYRQPLNDGERILETVIDGVTFRCAPWMLTQAEDFNALAPELTSLGCELTIHGDGLLPAMAAVMGRQTEVSAPDARADAILSRVNGAKSPVGAEIGVFMGALSKRLLSRKPDLTLLMVDSWAAQHDPSYADSGDFHASMSESEQEMAKEQTRAMTSFAGDRAKIIVKPSIDAARDVPDGSLDFVFIDADHTYEGCKSDIEAWFPKIRPGGFISGHDYANNEFAFGPQVKRAVDEMIPALGLTVELDANYTWFARKMENAT